MKLVIIRNLAACCAAISILSSAVPGQSAGQPAIDSNFINFGYIQSESILPHVRWNALTHVGTLFTSFDTYGEWVSLSPFTGRDATLKSGGAAQKAGVKVIMVALNSGFSSTVISSVMTSATARATLISNVVSAVASDAYCQGVSFDLEPHTYSTATRDGMILFFSALRTAFDASSKPDAEISLYTDATYSSLEYNIPSLEPNIDYFLYSCYDWGTGSTSHAISDVDNYVGSTRVNGFLNAGVPANKMVLVESSYGRRWYSQSSLTYGASSPGTTYTVSQGFTDGLYSTTLDPTNGGPHTNNYVTGDETGWYSYNDGTNNVAVWEDPEAMEYKTRLVLSMQDAGGTNNGKRLRGIGWWSLYWFGNFSTSRNPISGLTSSYNRTYPHLYQLAEEILSPPGTTKYIFEKFESLNPRWANVVTGSVLSPYNLSLNNASSSRTITASPGGAGAPADTSNAMALTFSFSGTPGRCFFRHEVLNDDTSTAVTDTNATEAHFDVNTTIHANVYANAAYTNDTVRLIVIDKDRNVEASPQFSIGTSGWQTFSWSINDTTAGNITGLSTTEPAFTAGDGDIDTAGGGAKDISFVGFLVERNTGGSASGTIYFDELSYEHHNPSDMNYKINEFRYSNAASEFVEIHGPAGTIPSGTELRFYSAGSSTIFATVDLSGQVIPASGLLVVGDTGVPNVNYIPSGWGASRNIPNTSPCAMQIYNTSSANVYDSAVYLAMGGLDNLIRKQTNGVTAEGYGWMGESASGTNSAGTLYSMGRYPDGTDTNWNQQDFSFMPASPGATNGKSIMAPVTYNFTSAPSTAFQTYQAFSVASPVSAGLPASPSGGNAHRCVDTSGGGVESVFGDAALGKASSTGYTVTGEIYLPAAAAPLQANGIGICGSQGSTFFTNSPDDSGYESGYWLIYENAAGVGLNDDLADHADTFKFVWAHNDRMHSAAVEELASATRASTGATQGAWTTFELAVSPSSPQLVAKINSTTIYSGALPTGGPSSGAFMAGFRENHVGAPAASEGTWIDNVSIAGAGVPVNLSSLTAD